MVICCCANEYGFVIMRVRDFVRFNYLLKPSYAPYIPTIHLGVIQYLYEFEFVCRNTHTLTQTH